MYFGSEMKLIQQNIKLSHQEKRNVSTPLFVFSGCYLKCFLDPLVPF